MKVLFLIQGLRSGGAERVASVLCNAMTERGIDVTLGLTEQTDNIAYDINERIELLDLSCHTGSAIKNRLLSIRKLRSLYKERKPDLVISFITRTNLCAILAGLGMGVPVIVSERNDPAVDPRSRSTRFLRSLLYPLASGLVFQTSYAQNYFGQSVQKKSTVIFNPISDDVLKVDRDGLREKKIILVGRLNKQKNISMLIQAFSRIHQNFPDYHVEIYGEGEERDSLQDEINGLQLAEKIHLMGFTKNIIPILASTEIFVLCSDYEGMPNALMEAMCAGCACISTDAPAYGARELVEHGVNGLLVGVGDVDALAKALSRMLIDDEARLLMAKMARNVQQRLDTEEILDQWLGFMASVK